ncbi:MAG: PIN domain-containing protein [Nanoarchaeota archaeon]
MYLIFDTSILISLSRGSRETIAKISDLRKSYSSPAKISFMSYYEFVDGLRNKAEKNKEKSMEFLEKFEVIQTTKNTALILASLKSKYELSLTDLMIAAQTIEANGILVTKDNDFKEIIELNKIVIN